MYSAYKLNKQGDNKQPFGVGEREEWKSSLKLNIQKMKITASDPITSRQIDEEKVGTVTDLIF